MPDKEELNTRPLLAHLNERQPKSAWMALMKAHPEFFEEALDLALSDKHPEGWRCAWLVSHIMHINDQRIQPLMLKMVQSLKRIRSGHQREMLNIISKMKLEEEHEGVLFDACLTIWEDVSKQPSVRITAFRQLVRIAWNHPELKTELKHFIGDEYTASLSPGIKNSLEDLVRKAGI